MTLCFIDTETTGLDPRIHQPYEVSFWYEVSDKPVTSWLPHDLTHADAAALKIGGYWERGADRESLQRMTPRTLASCLVGVTLVGSNPAFDAAMLTRFIGAPVWHHRMIDVSNVAMTVFDLDRPPGLAACVELLAGRGFEISEPDHTAEGDVRTTRAAYAALRDVRGGLR